ncbi:MAG: hypothetical protein RBR35_12280 [Salinivirgaceae bacterium]|nr:hypothetical protein [Salinivirgaceae bacterium]MDY0281325.1 hypothetical protein [Salinivirgaceae bacterium]
MRYLLLMILTVSIASASFAQKKIENEIPVDVESFYKKLSGLQINTWNFKGEELRNYGISNSELLTIFGTDSKGKMFAKDVTTENKTDLNFTSICVLAQTIDKLMVENGELRTEIKSLQDNINHLQMLQTDVMVLMQSNSKVQDLEHKVIELSTQLMDLKQEFKIFKEEPGRR